MENTKIVAIIFKLIDCNDVYISLEIPTKTTIYKKRYINVIRVKYLGISLRYSVSQISHSSQWYI